MTADEGRGVSRRFGITDTELNSTIPAIGRALGIHVSLLDEMLFDELTLRTFAPTPSAEREGA